MDTTPNSTPSKAKFAATLGRGIVDDIVAVRTRINRLITLQDGSDNGQEAIDALNSVLSSLLNAERKMGEFLRNKEELDVGAVQYVSNDSEAWIGRLPVGTLVIIRKANLGPGEKLKVVAGKIYVESYGGSVRNPPFIKLA